MPEAPNGPSADVDEIASKAGLASPEERYRMIEPLLPELKAAVRRVAHRYGVPDRLDEGGECDDLFQSAYLHLRDKLPQFDPAKAKGGFRGWITKVVNHLAVDRYRRRPKRVVADTTKTDEETSSLVDTLPSQECDPLLNLPTHLQGTLSEDDLDRLESWRVRDRLVVLSYWGWENRIPQNLVYRWLDECHVEWDCFHAALDPATPSTKRVGVLAAAFGMPPGTLRRDRDRKAGWIVELQACWDVVRHVFPQFTAAQLQTICSWEPRDRVVLLALAARWWEVPDRATWFSWTAEAGLHGLPLLQLTPTKTLAERVTALAKALCMAPQVLYAEWSQKSPMLDAL